MPNTDIRNSNNKPYFFICVDIGYSLRKGFKKIIVHNIHKNNDFWNTIQIILLIFLIFNTRIVKLHQTQGSKDFYKFRVEILKSEE